MLATALGRLLELGGSGRSEFQTLSLLPHDLTPPRRARGLSNAEIARTLTVGDGTVKTHVARMLANLGLRTRVHLVIHAYEHGLLDGS